SLSSSSFYFILLYLVFFFNDTATTEIYTLSLHDALPILTITILSKEDIGERAHPRWQARLASAGRPFACVEVIVADSDDRALPRSEEHTSELQSLAYLVCRLLLEKKKKNNKSIISLVNIC